MNTMFPDKLAPKSYKHNMQATTDMSGNTTWRVGFQIILN